MKEKWSDEFPMFALHPRRRWWIGSSRPFVSRFHGWIAACAIKIQKKTRDSEVVLTRAPPVVGRESKQDRNRGTRYKQEKMWTRCVNPAKHRTPFSESSPFFKFVLLWQLDSHHCVGMLSPFYEVPWHRPWLEATAYITSCDWNQVGHD